LGIQPPLAVPGLLLAWFVLKGDEPAGRPRFDIAGSVLLGGAMGALLFGLNRVGAAPGFARTDVVVPLALVPVLGVLFVQAERRAAEPLLHLGYFRQRNVALPTAIQGVSVIPYMGTFFLAPFLFQEVLGYGTSRTALVLVGRPLANSVMSALAGYFAVRVGERFTVVSGMAVMAGGLVLFARVGGGTTLPFVVAALVLTGIGLGLSTPGLVSSVANAVSEKDFGAIAAAQEMAQMVGNVLGMQGLQTVEAIRARSVGTVRGYHDAFEVGAVLAVVAMVMSFGVRSMHRAHVAPPAESPEAPLVPVAERAD
jgi:MFS family permease